MLIGLHAMYRFSKLWKNSEEGLLIVRIFFQRFKFLLEDPNRLQVAARSPISPEEVQGLFVDAMKNARRSTDEVFHILLYEVTTLTTYVSSNLCDIEFSGSSSMKCSKTS